MGQRADLKSFELKQFLGQFFYDRPWMVVGYVATMLVYPVGTVLVPSLAGVVLEKVKSRAPREEWGYLLWIFLGLAVLLLAQYLVGVFLDARLTTEMQAYVRTEVFERVLNSTDRNFEVQDTAIILSRVLKLPTAVVNVVRQYRNMVIPGAFTLFGVLVYFLWQDATHKTMHGFALMGVAVVLVLGLLWSAKGCFNAMVEADNIHDDLHNHLGDTLDNLLHIYLADASTDELERLRSAQKVQVDTMTTALQCPNYHVSVLQLILTAGLVGIGSSIVMMYYRKHLNAVELTAALFVLMCSRHILFNALAAWPHLLWSTSMMLKLGDYIDSLQPRDTATGSGATSLPQPQASLAFTGVTYRYAHDGRAVLQNASFSIDQPGMYALVGPIGSGKSTVAKLALGLHSNFEGTIAVAGASVQAMSRAQLSQRIMYVPATPPLLDLTIRENLQFGIPGCTDQRIHDALETLGVRQDPAFALDAPVGRGGTRLSTGQRVILYLARVMLRDAKVILCDEVTANLDSVSKTTVVTKLQALARTRVVLMITHDQTLIREQGLTSYRIDPRTGTINTV